MTPERWAQIKDIFAAVVERPSDGRRAALAELCHGEPELELEVERLLSQHDEMGGFLEGTSPPSGSSSSGHMLLPGEVLAGRYRILEFLGSGGMGEVYSAEDQDLGDPIAVKVIRQETPFGSSVLERLRREVQLARRVTHPNVCRVFDLGHHELRDQDFIFLTMELIQGETLSARLMREGKINSPEALLIAEQLCQALDAAHHAGILHRDFKTSNVMLVGSGEHLRAVVTDFGIARLMRPGASTTTGTGTAITQGMIVGTPAYMSPEQLLGEELTVATDIYSLGLVLYEMVTGNRPFQGASSWTETLKRLSAAPKAPVEIVHELGQRWNSTILRCLERNPARRFSSTHQVAESLRGHGVISNRLLLAAGTCILLIAGAGFAFRDRIWPPSLPQQKHVAVLPFTFQGTDAANQATAYELAESLTGNLARLEPSESSLWVVPWKEVRNQKPEDAPHAASTLGVNLLVTGELRKDAGGLRLHTELKDAGSLKKLRSQVIEIPATQVVTLEDSLLEGVAAMLQVRLPSGVLHHLPVDATTEPGAYEFYEQGRGYLLHLSPGTPEDVDRAIALLQKAIEKDSNFALAYANLAYAYAAKFRQTHDLQWLDKAKQRSKQALLLNDKLAAAHLALGLIHQETGDPDSAIHEFEQALQLDPSDAETINRLSLAYDSAGRLLQAEALLKDALKRTPGNWVNYNDLGYFYYRHADYSQAEPLFRTTTELAPDNPLAFYNLGGVYLAEGKYKEAETILTKGIAIRPTAGAYSNLALAHQYQGRYEDAAAMFQKAAELRPGDHRYWCNLGTAYNLAGNRPKAVEAFKTALRLAQKAADLHPRDTQFLGPLALYYAELGENTKAQDVLAQAARSTHNDPEFLFNSALVYELIGERERALMALRSTLRAGYSLSEIQNAPELARLRQDKRYSAIVGNSGS
ncbi:MAG TPA: tetratricopeptide repeat protein [Candidatus Angelobacter sp.]|nr:tetratricopeptide repeat protein [Candidatus Angelobacter sp.]